MLVAKKVTEETPGGKDPRSLHPPGTEGVIWQLTYTESVQPPIGTTVNPRFKLPPGAIVEEGADTFMLKSETCSVIVIWSLIEPSLAVTTTG
jgi:hypothetical protein